MNITPVDYNLKTSKGLLEISFMEDAGEKGVEFLPVEWKVVLCGNHLVQLPLGSGQCMGTT